MGESRRLNNADDSELAPIPNHTSGGINASYSKGDSGQVEILNMEKDKTYHPTAAFLQRDRYR